MRSRSSGARRLRALATVSLVMALLVSGLALTGCSLIGGGETKSTTPSTKTPGKSSSDATKSAEATSSAGGKVEASAPTTPTVVGYMEARRLLKQGVRFLCVEEAAAFKAEHIDGTTNVPMKSLVSESSVWNKSKPVLITSETEARSLSAAGYLLREGFAKVYVLGGGYDTWMGKFEGNNPRVRTEPVEMYVIYDSRVLSDTASDFSGKTVVVTASDLQEMYSDLEAMQDEFDDLAVTLVDIKTNASQALELIDRFDVPLMNLGAVQALWIPHFIAVDRDGNVTHMDSLPYDVHFPRTFAFLFKAREDAAARE